MSTPKWPFKDPDEVLDYVIRWTDRLQGDTIATSTWDVPTGITKDSDSLANGAPLTTEDGLLTGQSFTTIWLSDGTAGDSYIFTNHIVTAGGRSMDQSVKLPVKVR